MHHDDEPVLDRSAPPLDDARPPRLVDRIRRLFQTQPYAVLATTGGDHAYGSLIAFAADADLRTLVFATPKATRKYKLLTGHDRVALVVDDRSDHAGAMMDVEAVTVTGRAVEMTDPSDRDICARRLVARHPQLEEFAESDSCALFRMDVLRCFHVSRFQEVRQWAPERD